MALPEIEKSLSTIPSTAANDDIGNLYMGALQHLSSEEQEKCFNVFRSVDKDGNGELDFEEIQKAFYGLNISLDDDQLKDLMFDNDLTGTGTINEREFLIMVGGRKKFRTKSLNEQECGYVAEIFEHFDSNNDGFWEFDDFNNYYMAVNKENVAPFTEDDFIKVNSLLGSQDPEKMSLHCVEKFYKLLDRTIEPDLLSDYDRICS